MIKQVLFCLFVFSILGCKEVKETTDTLPNGIVIQQEDNSIPAYAKSSTIYEVNIRQFTEDGTFNAFSDHIPRLKHMGIEILSLMPIHPISKTNRKGNLGNYYAVSDYLEVNPEFGTKHDLINLINKIHAYGMKVILNWVPNYTGWDHRWLKNHPDFYIKDNEPQIMSSANQKTNQSYDRADLVDLNYNNITLRDSMVESLKHWTKYYKVDGFAMDSPYELPFDFWDQAISELKVINPNLFLWIESNEPYHLNSENFQVCYAWDLYYLMNDIANGKRKFKEFYDLRKIQDSLFQRGQFMFFITNHDENSWNGSEFERMGDAYQTFAVFTYFLDGIPLIYNGQEEPLKRKLKIFEKDNIDFDKLQASRFYRDLIHLKKKNQALWTPPHGGTLEILGSDDNVFTARRLKNNDIVYAIMNLSDQEQKVIINDPIINFKDVFKKTDINFPKGSELVLDPWEFVLAVPAFGK
jgi:glycosidase